MLNGSAATDELWARVFFFFKLHLDLLFSEMAVFYLLQLV